jgi:hypothetical protein
MVFANHHERRYAPSYRMHEIEQPPSSRAVVHIETSGPKTPSFPRKANHMIMMCVLSPTTQGL